MEDWACNVVRMLFPQRHASWGCYASAACFAAVVTNTASAADINPSYAVKPVRVIVPSGAGGADDVIARILAAKLSELYSQQFIVDNRPGAGGIVGHALVIKAPADGYTLLLGARSMAGTRFVNAQVNSDVLRDYTPISLLEHSHFVMLVHPSVPARNVKDYIALAKVRPGKMTYASLGTGQTTYWCVTLFNSMARINAVEIPYKTGTSAIVDLIAGQVDYFFPSAVLALSNRDKLRALAVTGAERSALLPDVPTMSEAALPGYDMPSSRTLLGPSGMHRDIVVSLNAAIGRALAAPDLRERFVKAGSQPAPSTPEELTRRYAAWAADFARIAKDAGIRPQ
jgi:tripartite-type tricarboxylate transporter receptor subunit TctC